MRELIDAGVFRMLMPRSLSGDEIDPMSTCRVVEEVSTQDGAAGWCAMIGAANGHFAGLLPAEGARQIFADRNVVLAGAFRPTGVAEAVDGGYRVTGHWPFASGIMHSDWLFGGCRIMDGDSPRMTPAGAPVVKLMFLPRAEGHVLDTWHTDGLRGTGSHDFEVKGVFVPASRSVWFTDPPVERGPLYSLPAITLFSPMIASVALGIARHALEEFKDLAAVKKPTRSQDLLRARPVAQSQLGEAEGLLRAGRAFLFEALGDAWEVARRGEFLSWEQRGLLRRRRRRRCRLSTSSTGPGVPALCTRRRSSSDACAISVRPRSTSNSRPRTTRSPASCSSVRRCRPRAGTSTIAATRSEGGLMVSQRREAVRSRRRRSSHPSSMSNGPAC